MKNGMDNRVVAFVEVLIPITKCNIKCHYCYVAQRSYRTMEFAHFQRSPEEIAYALRPERFGGRLYISLCGAGETMMQKELPAIVANLLDEGHFVNVTTNGTISKSFDELLSLVPPSLLPRLNFSFSFHFLELRRTALLERFWANVEKVRDAGCSFIVQVNLCDEYEPYFEEIKQECLLHVGALPQLAATRDEVNLTDDIRLFTQHSREEYVRSGESFHSPLFDFTMQNFMKKHKEFCYAGKLSYTFNMATGILKPCYCSNVFQNLYKNMEAPIRLTAIGRHCKSPLCMNSSHFISLGVIPDYPAPTYAELRNRKCSDGTEWYSK